MFQGFTRDAIEFLTGIRENNEKAWFEAHKQQYLDQVYTPMTELGKALFAPFSELREMMYKVSRIYKDVTFAPHLHYRDTMWIYMLYQTDYWSRTPILFFELSPEGAAFGMKLTAPDAACMERFRQRLIQDPDSVLSLTKRLEQEEGIVFSGTEYKRKKPGETPETAPLFQRKNLFAVKTMPVGDTLFSPALPDAVIPTFRALLPLMELFGKQEQAKVQEGDAAYPSAVIEEKYGGFMW